MDWTTIIISSIAGGYLFRLFVWPVSKRIGSWLGRNMSHLIKKGLGIQEVTKSLEDLGIKVDSIGKEQRRLRNRIVKLEKALPNPGSSSPESKDEGSQGEPT